VPQKKAEPKPPRNWLPLLIVTVLVAVAGAAIWYYLLRPGAGAPPQPAPLTAEARAYVRNLGLAGVQMKARESMMGGTLVEITGKITNNGGRNLARVELNCVFYDAMNQVVLRERVPIVRGRDGVGLKPGETRDFRLPFDNIPESWNQALPQLVIAAIDFQQ
jgi:flagellar basal body-associated protein FliL